MKAPQFESPGFKRRALVTLPAPGKPERELMDERRGGGGACT